MPFPKHVHIPISFEINRINKENSDVTIILNDHNDTATLGAISEKKFSSEPTAEEMQITIIRPMYVLDSHFSSLMCAIFGVATDEELKQRMLSSFAAEDTKDNSVIFQVKDPYHDPLINRRAFPHQGSTGGCSLWLYILLKTEYRKHSQINFLLIKRNIQILSKQHIMQVMQRNAT